MNEHSTTAKPADAQRCVACGGSSLRLVYDHPEYQVYRCQDCTMAQAPEIVAPQAGTSKVGSSSTPDEKLDEYEQTFEAMKAQCLKSMAERIPFFERLLGRRIESALEIGCANGVGYSPFQERGIRWLGLDTNSRWIEHGKRRGIPVVAKDLDEVAEQFDLVYTQQVLEHIDQPLPFLQQARERLKSDGVLHVAVPNHSGFTALKRRALPSKTPHDYGFIQYPYHMRAYNKRSLRTLLERAGFSDVTVRAIRHTHLCWGEWDTHSVPKLHRAIFGAGGALGLGTLLFGYARKS